MLDKIKALGFSVEVGLRQSLPIWVFPPGYWVLFPVAGFLKALIAGFLKAGFGFIVHFKEYCLRGSFDIWVLLLNYIQLFIIPQAFIFQVSNKFSPSYIMGALLLG